MAAFGVSLLAPPALACPLELLQQATGHEQVAAAYRAVLAAGADCTAVQQDWAGRIAAERHVQEAQRVLAAGGSPTSALALLDAGLGFGPLWPGLVMRGDLRQRLPGPDDRVDFAAASEDYQAALSVIDASDPAVDPVPEFLIRSIWHKAQQTRMLADRPVAYPTIRGGAPRGLALPGIRSFRPVAVAMPIQFVFGSDEFTPAGARAAEDLAHLLEAEGRPRVRLVGHTDPEGTDAYNMQLSRRRAAAVARFLVARGYDPGLIAVDGRGKREPLAIEGLDGYTQEQINRIFRRVEMQRP